MANKNLLDHGLMQLKQIFQKLTFEFCNDNVHVPVNSKDVDGWDTLDPNDSTQIRIHRDCMLLCLLIISLFRYH